MEEVRICEPGGQGLIMPLFGRAEQDLDPTGRTVIYGFSLAYSFVGVSVVADLFMNSIEAITGKVLRVKRPGSDRLVTKKLWNDTVANLTLMALGSSAPEIMLSVVETLKEGHMSGELGPSTILGSAAFNLLVIIAACIMAIPSPEVRCIDAISVFFVTAVFSILAYVWLLLIVDLISPGVVDIWEALVTLLLLPVLVVLSYACDKGWICNFANADDEGSSGKKLPQREVSASSGEAANAAGGELQIDGGTGGSGGAQLCIVPGASPGTKGSPQGELVCDENGVPIQNVAGVLTFGFDEKEVSCGLEKKSLSFSVFRRNGSAEKVGCKFSTRGLTAVPGFDFEPQEDEEISFADGEVEAKIELVILPRRPGQKPVQLQVVLEDAMGDAQFHPDMDGGEEQNILTLTVVNEAGGEESGCLACVDHVFGVNSMKAASAAWVDNIKAATNPKEECQEGSPLDRFCLVLMYPWSVFYSVLVPPPEFFGGWFCFVFSLVHIFGLTAIIVDLAELFGCVAGVKDAMTAITFVALGTSMPDFFASKTSALQDDNADASIVNVTGSNSVNVFLGIGLPWTIAAIYWAVNGPSEKWLLRYPEVAAAHHPNAVFVVDGSGLGFAVATFSAVAIIALGIIRWRRIVVGGELGGPAVSKVSTSFTLFALWCYYIGICGWRFENEGADLATQVGTASWVLAVVLAICVLFTAGFWLIHTHLLSSGGAASVVPGGDEEEGKQEEAGQNSSVSPTKMGWQRD
eukprot:gb/GFBE01033355.1/.p1 GENE.gb/GFBE01033355.1/~~gb/GFBE01033355.1/.p1  ORF type:complete len:747 (+),score=177.61 gb/GFBE01033355.1/:1-2241(+)